MTVANKIIRTFEKGLDFQSLLFFQKMRLLVCLLTLHLNGWGQTDSIPQISFLKKTIEYLASDSLKGRAPNTPEINLALLFIREKCKIAGLKPYYQNFTFTYNGNEVHGKNCYAFLDNKKQNTIVIGAHYDHIGMGGELSRSFRSDQVHNGADDNASGVAMALALANDQKLRKLNVNVLFVFYTAHEIGLFGSKAFVDPFLKQKKRFRHIAAVINFDMIGRMNHANELFIARNPEAGLPISGVLKIVEGDPNSLEQLDTAPYISMHLPVYNVSTGNHSDYHKISDDERFINYSGMSKTFEFVLDWLLTFQ